MESAFATPLARAIEDVFNTTMQLFVRTVAVRGSAWKTPGAYTVRASIEFSGDVAGNAVLCMTPQTAARLVQLMTGGPDNEADAADALGELTEMICGRAMNSFTNGGRVKITPAKVAWGKNPPAANDDTVFIPCSTDCGEMAIEINLRARVAARAAA